MYCIKCNLWGFMIIDCDYVIFCIFFIYGLLFVVDVSGCYMLCFNFYVIVKVYNWIIIRYYFLVIVDVGICLFRG